MKKSIRFMFAAAAAASLSLQAYAADAPAAAPAPAPAKAPAPAEKAEAPVQPQAPATLESALAFLPDVLAEVNGEKITKKEFIAQLELAGIPPAMLAQYPQEILKKLVAAQVDEMVSQKVMLALAAKDGYVPSAELVNKEMDAMYAKLTPQQKEQFESNLKAQGRDYKAYKAEVAKNPNAQKAAALTGFMTKNFIEKMKDSVTDADVESFYRRNQALFEKPSITVSHILVLTTGTDRATGKELDAAAKAKEDAAAKAKIEGILAKLKQGQKFEDLAEKESDCPSGKSSKGKLPPFTTQGRSEDGGMLESTFVKAAFALEKPGQLSDVVKTPFGYHILRLEEKKDPQFTDLKEVKDDIKAKLISDKISVAVKDCIQAARKEMNAKNFLEEAPVVVTQPPDDKPKDVKLVDPPADKPVKKEEAPAATLPAPTAGK